jgi:hypothetical protein
MELSPSGGAANSAATEEFPSILWNPKVHYQLDYSLLQDIGSYLFYNIVTVLFKAHLGNDSINTFHCATMEAVSQWTNVIARC